MSKQRTPLIIVQGMDHGSQNVRERKELGSHLVQSLHFVNERREDQRSRDFSGVQCTVLKWQCQEYSLDFLALVLVLFAISYCLKNHFSLS